MPPPVLAPHSSLSPQSLLCPAQIAAIPPIRVRNPCSPPPGSSAPACKPCAVPCKPRASHLRAPAPPPPGRDPCPTPTRAVARPLMCVQAGAMWITFQTRSRRDTGRPSMDGRPLPWKARSATMVCASHPILSGHGMHRAPFLPCPYPRPLQRDHPCRQCRPTAPGIHAHLPSASTNEPVTLPPFSSLPWRPSAFPIPQPPPPPPPCANAGLFPRHSHPTPCHPFNWCTMASAMIALASPIRTAPAPACPCKVLALASQPLTGCLVEDPANTAHQVQ